MISLTIEFDKKKTAMIEAALSGVKNGAPRAMVRAINRTVTYGKTRASKLIREEYTINASAIERATDDTPKATAGNLRGIIRWKGRPKQLRNFAIRKRGGISVSVKRNTGFKRLTRRAFVNTINTGPALMVRLGKSRYPLDVKHSLSVPQMTGNVNVESKIRKDVENKLDERIQHEMNVILKGYVK